MFDVHRTCAAAYTVSIDGDAFRFSAANQACLDMAGLTASFHPGLTPHDCFPADVAEKVVDRYRACRDGRKAVTYVSEVKVGQLPRRWRTTLLPVLDDTGRVTSIFGTCVDTSDEAHGPLEVEASHEKLTLALGAIDGGFWVYEIATGVFETSTPLAEFVAGPGHASLNLAEYASYVHAEDFQGGTIMKPADEKSLADYRVITYDGRTRWMRSRRRVVRDSAGMALRVVSLVSDITEQKTALLALETEASTDPLTAVKNRRAFDRAATDAFRQVKASRGTFGLLLIDLDGFKPVNDRFGHSAGDEILRQVARRLARQVRRKDTLARLGGDEFAILIRHGSLDDGYALARRIGAAFEKPFTWEAQPVFVGISVGVAVSTPDDTSTSALIARADDDLYATKKKRHLLTA